MASPLAESHMTRSGRAAWESLLLTFGYPLLAILIATTWLLFARTEVRTPPFANVQRMVRGESIKPWIYRRLVPDGGMLLSRLVPRKTWDELSDRIEHSPRLKTVVREHLGWPREQDPLLFSVSAMIAASALGFMWCTLWLIRRLYQVPAGVSHGTGMLLGIGLLGGRGSATFVWHQYPYDLPQAFLFLGCVCCVLAGSWLISPSFLLAVYNKETSVLILPAILMLWPGDRRTRWGLTGVLTFLYAAVQFWIRWRFRYADAFSLTTSYYNVMNLVFGSW